jgi:hypothetical protein
VLWIRTIETLITVVAAHNQMRCLELGQLILHGPQRKKTQARELPRIQLLPSIREKQSQQFRAYYWKQSMQKRLFHRRNAVLTALSSQVPGSVRTRGENKMKSAGEVIAHDHWPARRVKSRSLRAAARSIPIPQIVWSWSPCFKLACLKHSSFAQAKQMTAAHPAAAIIIYAKQCPNFSVAVLAALPFKGFELQLRSWIVTPF